MAGTLYKPSSDGSVNPGGASFLTPKGKYNKAEVVDSSGKVIDTLTLSPFPGHGNEAGNDKFYSRRPGGSYGSGIKIRVTGDGGSEEYDIGEGSHRYEFGSDGVGADMGGAQQIGQYGFAPQDLTGEFPGASLISDYKPIKAPKFKFIDPMNFAEKYGEFNRNEIGKNWTQAKDMALQGLNVELEGLRSFVPAASALKRSEVALDNIFNQEQRTQQINSTLPEIRGQMDAQGRRAETFASGRVPDEITDRALELNVRSAAADQASAGGFGAKSSVARKVSDLMSADQRIKLSQYGDQLLSQNVEQKVRTFLAPTEYSDAGAQVRVMPEVGAGRLAAQNLAQINQDTLISPTNALSSSIQQREFLSELKLKNRQFNRQMKFNTEQFNASTENQFSLAKFGYQVGLAGSVAGAAQVDSNTQLAMDQQATAMQIYQEYLEKGQNAQELQTIAQGVGVAAPALISAVSDLISSIGGDSAGTDSSLSVPTDTISDLPEFSIGANEPSEVTSSSSDIGSSVPEFSIQASNAPEVISSEAPASFETPELRSFTADTAISPKVLSSPNQAVTKELIKSGNQVMRSAGLSSQPMPDSVPVGFSNTGAPVFAATSLLRSANINTGAGATKALEATLAPMNFLTPEDRSKFSNIAEVSSDAALISSLSAQAANRDADGFINTVLNKFEQPILNKLTDSPKDRQGLSTAFGAYQVFQNWDKMSGAQKGMALASLGIKATKFANGQDLSKAPIVKPTPGNPGLNVGQAMSLFQSGVNVYSLVNNWSDYNTINKVSSGVNTAASIANTAKNLNLLGKGPDGAAMLPGGQALQTAGGAAAIAAGAYTVYQGWGKGGSKGAVNGGIGGSGIVVGLNMLGYSNPYVAAAIIAASVLGNTIQVGKSKDQGSRDAVRSMFKENGLADKDYNITLADGSKSNIGIDGHGGQHSATNPSKLVNGSGKLNAWDIDYTNDLDYVAGMGGTSLARILTGSKETNVDQLGGQLGNATLGNIGYGQQMSKGNFDKLMANQRAVFSQSGIKSKSDAYSLAEQAAKEGRISATDLVTAQQSFNMIFDNDFSTAERLMSGRFRGAEVAKETPATPKQEQPQISDTAKNVFNFERSKVKSPTIYRSKEELRNMNQVRYG